MKTRIKQFMLVATLGVILSVVFVQVAQASFGEPNFDIAQPAEPCETPCTVTVTDKTVAQSENENEFTYEWDENHQNRHMFDQPLSIHTGSPECLNVKCNQAQWTYPSPGYYVIAEAINALREPSYLNESDFVERAITVVNPHELPPIILESPRIVSLPTVIEAASVNPNMYVNCIEGALRGLYSTAKFCNPYLIKRVGPDGSGLYHYLFRLPMAAPGEIELMFSAWGPSSRSEETYTITATGNAYQFGDVHTYYWPVLRNGEGKPVRKQGKPIKHVFELYYYAAMNSRVVVKLQVRQGNRWVTKKHAGASFLIQKEVPWWTRWGLQIFLRTAPRHNLRFIYEIKHGRKLLKRGRFSTKQICTPFAENNEGAEQYLHL